MKNKKTKETGNHRASLRSRILAVAALLAAAALLLYFGIGSDRLAKLSPIPENALVDKPTLNLWYTDESLSDFLAAAALDFSEGSEVRVIPRLVSGLEYLESNNTVMVHIRRLREKLGENTRKPKFIKTVWGVGYKIE